jgi:hypothetical protein
MRAGRSFRALMPALLLLALPVLIVAGLPWRCPMLLVTGLPCPTCGITRALRLALHGDLAGATRMHPLWFVVVLACVGVAVWEIVTQWREGRWGGALDRRSVQSVLGVIAVALVVVWAARFTGAFGGPVRP